MIVYSENSRKLTKKNLLQKDSSAGWPHTRSIHETNNSHRSLGNVLLNANIYSFTQFSILRNQTQPPRPTPTMIRNNPGNMTLPLRPTPPPFLVFKVTQTLQSSDSSHPRKSVAIHLWYNPA